MNPIDKNEPVLYFAYGSNMNPERMSERGALFYSRRLVVLPGYSLKFHKQSSKNPDIGVANIVPDGNGVVEGILYKVTWAAILNLDKYENYPNEYDRVILNVSNIGEESRDVLTYTARSERIKEGLRPTRNYLNHLLEARDMLSENYINRLKLIETLD